MKPLGQHVWEVGEATGEATGDATGVGTATGDGGLTGELTGVGAATGEGAITGAATGAGGVGRLAEHPRFTCNAVLTVLDHCPLTSSAATQKNAPPLHG